MSKKMSKRISDGIDVEKLKREKAIEDARREKTYEKMMDEGYEECERCAGWYPGDEMVWVYMPTDLELWCNKCVWDSDDIAQCVGTEDTIGCDEFFHVDFMLGENHTICERCHKNKIESEGE